MSYPETKKMDTPVSSQWKSAALPAVLLLTILLNPVSSYSFFKTR